ncbi:MULTISPECIES: hypothetical protein [unclassified Streptomyces]|uniref:hypothetical protein n=1 Tax=unclassified Streptomyces TaxID=2593676 RepID=UPI0015874533|nr:MULTISPECIES: hypothetical protein [unclassified Streptomyces]NUV71921.1 hypothetical protein [Streptomyces sp. CAI-121]NUW03690.1 hypothetical protein [Streptomyces sp. CAI 127]NUW16825.1 hypothetical protein [Streptomyces sp. CAI-68]
MRKWTGIAVGVNLLLGIPGVVPVWMIWYFATNGPLASLGWTQREPTENDGILPMLLIGVPVLTVSVLLWVLANWPVRHRTTLSWWRYAPAALLVTLIPTFTLMIIL